MQNKGLIKVFAILFGIVSLYQLSFTFFTNKIEDQAKAYAKEHAVDGNARSIDNFERIYLDSVASQPAIDLGFTSFTYNDIKDKSINLGLDLKGGINAILQVSVKDILVGLSNDSKNEAFLQALAKADEAQKSSDDTYLNLFFKAFEETSKGSVKLSDPSIFGNKQLRDRINFKMSNTEVEPIIEGEVSASISTAFQVLRSRIDKFGVTQPDIQRIGKSGRIQIELPGAKDIERVKVLLQSTAELQFWEVYTNAEMSQFFFAANTKVAELIKAKEEGNSTEETEVAKDSTKTDDIDNLLGQVSDSLDVNNQKNLFTYLLPNIPQGANQVSSVVGYAKISDTAKVNKFFKERQVRALLPANMRYVKFLWDAKPNKDSDNITLYAIKSNREDKAPLEGDVIDDAYQQFDQFGANPQVSMTMNSRGTKEWAKLTGQNVGNFVAVVLDNYVYTAPRINDAITGGSTAITGNFTITEAQDLANVLKAGKLPAAAHIIQSEVVGPSLGQKAIDASVNSFLLALALVLVWMIVYYGKAGVYADIALAVNILFIFGVLTAFGAVLTLPGIAGIILTIGMSVDANVLIFERIKEELNGGKTFNDAVKDGFNGALSSILDANVTTLLTGFILYSFGTGPVKGFAYTLIVGILTSLFTAIFITRLLVDGNVVKNKPLEFVTSMTKGWFKNIDIDFLKKRKIAYVISSVIIIAGIVSLSTQGLKYGVDFDGGRSYTVKFDKVVSATEVAEALQDEFNGAPEVKTYGTPDQLKITTNFMIEENGPEVDNKVQELLYDGLKSFLPEGMTFDQFKGGYEGQTDGIMSSIKVEPSIADDIKTAAKWAILGSIIVIFLYIFIRFKKVSYSAGAIVAVVHDVLIVLSVFSILYKFLPFDLEVDESFIAAVLTVVGYSINDTVVIFDRIREFSKLDNNWNFPTTVNKALSSTLGRTINTSITTLIVLLAIFLFGGDSIKGFMFALIVGVITGTYSSLFVATPVMFDTTKKEKNEEK
ncbi:protein translocase subunit SecDF [Aureivirga sp. CE67]|uniref:protein translocase subunit SecDF n=1 Tax=Aureivirga sp. CE67 TaxID=1788983 RepID=UPI0018C9A1D4|nr:protein translocase subunit SecDF [Aureivirga sp. CE67]